MSQYKAFLLSLNKDADLNNQWDYGLLRAFLTGRLWQPVTFTGFDIKTVNSLPEMADSAIVAIPARHHKGMEYQINLELQKISKVVLFLMGDEEADLNVELINHPNIHIWVQNPHFDKHDKYNRLGTGMPSHMLDMGLQYANKKTDVFFSGQITHQRRDELVRVLEAIKEQTDKNIVLNKTDGFTQGLEPKEYYADMIQTKIAPCPSGAVIADSFRLFEALECMTVPIADQKTPDGKVTQYWDWLFEETVPFDCVDDFDRLFVLLDEIESDYYNKLHEITCWWIRWKRKFAYKIMEQLNDN
jgi:hypothetical protein